MSPGSPIGATTAVLMEMNRMVQLIITLPNQPKDIEEFETDLSDEKINILRREVIDCYNEIQYLVDLQGQTLVVPCKSEIKQYPNCKDNPEGCEICYKESRC